MIITERELINLVRNVVNEAIEKGALQEKDEKNNKKSSSKKGKSSKSKRSIVINWLKNDGINGAFIMRKLWHPKTQTEEDSKRSYFYKCRDGVPNKETGVPYRFTDKEITTLYKIRSNFSAY